jgi:hypothetical protein
MQPNTESETDHAVTVEPSIVAAAPGECAPCASSIMVFSTWSSSMAFEERSIFDRGFSGRTSSEVPGNRCAIPTYSRVPSSPSASSRGRERSTSLLTRCTTKSVSTDAGFCAEQNPARLRTPLQKSAALPGASPVPSKLLKTPKALLDICHVENRVDRFGSHAFI